MAGAVPSSASAAAAPRTSLFSPDWAGETQEVGLVVMSLALKWKHRWVSGLRVFLPTARLSNVARKQYLFVKNYPN
jgi:hypothetical protein